MLEKLFSKGKPEHRISALNQQIAQWTAKQSAIRTSRDAIEQRRAELSAEREGLVWLAYGENDTAAKTSIERLDREIAKCATDIRRFDEVAATVESKLPPLRDELALAEVELKRGRITVMFSSRADVDAEIAAAFQSLKSAIVKAEATERAMASAVAELPMQERLEISVQRIKTRANNLAQFTALLDEHWSKGMRVWDPDLGANVLASIDALPIWPEPDAKTLYKACTNISGIAGQTVRLGDRLWLTPEFAKPFVDCGSLVPAPQD